MSAVAPALTLVPVTLILVLVISAIAKLAAPASTASAVRLLRLPEWLNPTFVSKALPPGEIVLALLMLSPWLPLARVAALLALGLFLSYWVIIARAMTFTPRPSCGCFGRIGDQRVTWKTVVRNTLLVLGSLVFLWMTWVQDVTAWTLFEDVTDRELWIFGTVLYLALMLWFIIAPANYGPSVWQEIFGKGKHAHDHPQPGTVTAVEPGELDELEYVRKPIPDAFLLDTENNAVSLRELTMTGPVLLVFVNCGCASTKVSWGRLQAWDEMLPAVRVLGVQTYQLGDLGIEGVKERLYFDPRAKAWEALEIPATSSAVLLGADGLLAGGPVSGNDETEAFVQDIAEVLSESHTDAEAEPAPVE